ncbi:MAG: DNA-processing protein DprA [Treponema sp.]|jgi:DNA processing protein|nr:DNA-processing protein DprA [Treponema sp.]
MDERGLLDLMIARIPGLSVLERGKLCRKFDREEELAILSKRDIELFLDRPLRRPWTMEQLRVQAEKDAAAARLRGIRWVSLASPAYPPLLREMYDPPAALFFRGRLPDPEKPAAAIVGTRRPSGRALAQAFDIARELSRQGIVVVSGLALGIDAMAHRGSLEAAGAPTVAVLGSGADEVYPASNRALARRILESGGAILSEYPPGVPPRKWYFPARNRIISALARGVLIVEAPANSGALITARFALEQNRDLWVASSGALPSPGGAGTARLAEEGAKIIRAASDILDEWNIKSVQIEEKKGRELWR